MPKTKTPPETDDTTDDAVEMVEIPFRGATFVIPKDRGEWSTEGLAHLAEERYNLFVKYTLELALPGQWDVLVRVCPRRRDYQEFFVVFGQATQNCIN